MVFERVPEVPLDDVYESLKRREQEWLETTLRNRWKQLAVPEAETALYALQQTLSLEQESMGPHDITGREIAPDRISEHLIRFRAHDWASTDLGPMKTWAPDLRRMVNLCMADPRVVTLVWGAKRLLLYNDAYRTVLADRDAWALGRPVTEVWHDLPQGGHFHSSFDYADATGLPSFGDDTCFFVERQGKHEELWASWAVIPIPGAANNIGYYNAATESTRQVMYERRMSLLLSLERQTGVASDRQGLWKQIIAGLESNRADVPFAALYSNAVAGSMPSRDGDRVSNGFEMSNLSRTSSNSSFASVSSQWTLEGVLESAPGILELPESITSLSAADILGPLFEASIETRKIQVLRAKDSTFPKSLAERALSREYGDQCREALIIPICQGHRRNPVAFLLLGINSRSTYSADYQRFTSLLAQQLATAMNSVAMAEDEAWRIQTNELARVQLAEKLSLSEHDAKEKETRFRRMAEKAQVAMFEFGPEGDLNYANETWYRLTGHARNDYVPFSWTKTINPADREHFMSHWTRLLAGESLNFEMRFTNPCMSDDCVADQRMEIESWVSFFAYPERNPDGSVKNILGCAMDISHFKWMLSHQERQTADALELKRQQEAFMDMTSHEARNPLSAISLCIESILDTFHTLLDKPGDQLIITRDTIASSLESAETVMACVAHQKTIIDDVLTLSKLKSGLLAVSPVEVVPCEEVSRVLKIFDGEITEADIDLKYTIDQSYRDLSIDWVLLDPVRFLQIMINLVSNAIKFTKNESTRRITVDLSASRQRPSSNNGVRFMPGVGANEDHTVSETAEHSTLYLKVTIKDTGRGIESHDLENLFQRFQQGSPRTHVKYGGSGLGLFICKELAGLQGGQIGVASAPGEGALFEFFVRASHCTPPDLSERHAVANDSRGMVRKPSTSTRRNRTELKTGRPANEIQARSIHILLVEDNLVNQKVMAKQLRRAGYVVEVANHGQEALDHIQTTQFCTPSGAELDLVLMDIEMPVMDGLECARCIRAKEINSEICKHVPLIAVTANARAEQQQDALANGFDSVITKPFRMGDLLPQIEQFRVD